MAMMEQLDPELRQIVASLPILDLTDITHARQELRRLYEMTNVAGKSATVAARDVTVPGMSGEPDVDVRIFQPREATGVLPCLVWAQGGGYVLTAPDFDDQFCEQICNTHRCVVISIDWRRAPETRYPGALHDFYASTQWAVTHAAELGIDPRRVVIGGHSSGGGLTASLAQLIRDRGEFTVAHQLLIYPMVDHTGAMPSNQRITDPHVWNRESNRIGWREYLGDLAGSDEVPGYAAAAAATDLSQLPAATVLVGQLDPLLDEDISYAQRLLQAGVSTELHVYRAAHHAFDRHAPLASVTTRFNSDRDHAIALAFSRRTD